MIGKKERSTKKEEEEMIRPLRLQGERTSRNKPPRKRVRESGRRKKQEGNQLERKHF